MLIIKGTEIHLTRADTAIIDVTITNSDGTPYEVQEGDRVVFRLRKDGKSSPIICEKDADMLSMTLTLEPEDTEPCENGKDYRYEFELITASGMHCTFIENAIFHIGVELEVHR
jgi:hypothetical protein